MTLNAQQIGLARKLWWVGKNTHEIAAELHLPEFLIYNGRHYFTETTPRTLAGNGIVSAPMTHDEMFSALSVASTLRRSSTCLPTETSPQILSADGAKR